VTFVGGALPAAVAANSTGLRWVEIVGLDRLLSLSSNTTGSEAPSSALLLFAAQTGPATDNKSKLMVSPTMWAEVLMVSSIQSL
jgi:hypothetical protein